MSEIARLLTCVALWSVCALGQAASPPSAKPKPQPGREEYGLHDELLLGQGVDTASGRQRPSPFEPVDPNTDVYPRTPGDPGQQFRLVLGSSQRSKASGASLDARVEAAIEFGPLSVDGNASASWQVARAEDTYAFSMSQVYYLDYGEYWIKPQALKLTKMAEAVLAKDPKRFIEVYGDAFVIGDKRWSYLTAKYSAQSISERFSTNMGLRSTAHGEVGPIAGGSSLTAQNWLVNSINSTALDVSVNTNADSSPQIGEIVKATVAQGNTERAKEIVAQIGGIAAKLGSSRPSAYRMVTVPMAWVVPLLPAEATGPCLPQTVADHQNLLERLLHQRSRLAEVQRGFGPGGAYAFLPAPRKTALAAAAEAVEARVREERACLARFFGQGVLPPPAGDPVELAWPDPYVVVTGFSVRYWHCRNLESQATWDFRRQTSIAFRAHDVASPCHAFLVSGTHRYQMPGEGTLVDGEALGWSADLDGYNSYRDVPNNRQGGNNPGGEGGEKAEWWVGGCTLDVELRDRDNAAVFVRQGIGGATSKVCVQDFDYWPK